MLLYLVPIQSHQGRFLTQRFGMPWQGSCLSAVPLLGSDALGVSVLRLRSRMMRMLMPSTHALDFLVSEVWYRDILDVYIYRPAIECTEAKQPGFRQSLGKFCSWSLQPFCLQQNFQIQLIWCQNLPASQLTSLKFINPMAGSLHCRNRPETKLYPFNTTE